MALWLLSALVALCSAGRDVAHGITTREEMRNETGNSTTTEPVLTGEAIANISASLVAICVLSSVLCYLFLFFNKQERMVRVRTALERNRQIDRQIAEARARQAQAQVTGKEGGSSTSEPPERRNLLFSQVHKSHEQSGGRNEGLVTAVSVQTAVLEDTTESVSSTTPLTDVVQPADQALDTMS